MDLLNVQPRSRWTSLLWKDFHQVKFVILMVAGSSMALQILTTIWGLLEELNQRPSLLVFENIPFWAIVGPTLVALGCCGMLIGHERQSGTWNWQSSLPISWRESLSSKLIVTLLSSLLTFVLLATIPAVLLATQRLTYDWTSIELTEFRVGSLLVFLQVIAVSFVVSLLMRETLNALVATGLLLTVGQALLIALVVDLTYKGAPTIDAKSVVIVAYSIVFTGLAGLLVAYRWRWSNGQFTELFVWRKSVPVSTTHPTLVYLSSAQPSQWRMQFVLSLRNSLGLRLLVLLGPLPIIIFTALRGWWPFAAEMFVPWSIAIFGLTAFAGDRSVGRFQFLADRGVNPTALVTSRLIAAAAWANGFLILYSILVFTWPAITWTATQLRGPLQICNILALFTVAFLVPALLSMAFQKPMFAGGIALVTLLGALAIGSVLSDRASANPEFSGSTVQWIITNPAYWSPIQSVILLATIYTLARRWIVLDDERVRLVAFATVFIVLFLPCIVLALF